MKKHIFPILFMLNGLMAFAASSGEFIYNLSSPEFLGMGAYSLSSNNPQGSSINPAALGFTDSLLTNFNYSYLFQRIYEENYNGIGLNMALSVPSQLGNFSGSFHYIDTSKFQDTTMNYGRLGLIDFAYSKKINKSFVFGLGVKGTFGDRGTGGAGLNLGLIKRVESWKGLQNIEIGGSLNNIGSQYSIEDNTYRESIPENITPQLAFKFDYMDNKKFTGSVLTNFKSPSFTDFQFDLGFSFLIVGKFKISTHSSMVLSEFQSQYYYTLLPSIGFSYSNKINTKKSLINAQLNLGSSTIKDGVVASGIGVTTSYKKKKVVPQKESIPSIQIKRDDSTNFSPNGDGNNDTFKISYIVNKDSSIAEWSFSVFDPQGNEFYSKKGTSLSENPFTWDGLSKDKESVQPFQKYSYIFSLTDNKGKTTLATGSISTDFFLSQRNGHLEANLTSLVFEPDKSTLVTKSIVGEENTAILKRIGETLKDYSNYTILIIGHAVSTGSEENREKEEKEELIPLSLARAQTIKDSLVADGIDEKRISIKGVGGQKPLVPHSDLENRWKNRRVEIILDKIE